MDDFLADLNDEQRAAVQHVGGPLLVLAGPGTGKTRVITRRLAYRVASGVAPERLLAITFTNRAADEMKGRVGSLIASNAIRIGTFHWVCGALLRRYIHHLGYNRSFQLLGPHEARQVLRDVMKVADNDGAPHLSHIASAISAVKNGASCDAAAQAERLAPSTLRCWATLYNARLRAMQALDLDDVQALSVTLLRDCATVRKICARAFDEILVDEYQDVNPVQRDLLKLLRPGCASLIAVGDEDQAIYGWRQADVDAMLRFSEDFPAARIIKVSQSYRSTKHILRAASSLIERNRQRISKTLRTDNVAGSRPVCLVAHDERDEAEWIAREILRLVAREGRKWDDFSILYRVGAQSRAIEDALLRHEIPYVVLSGPRFYERAEVRRVMAYLRLVLDPADDGAALLLLQQMKGIGPARLDKVERFCRTSGKAMFDVISGFCDQLGLPATVAATLSGLVTGVRQVQEARRASLVQVVEEAIRVTEADAGDFGDAPAVQENLDELRSVVLEYNQRKHTLRSFVDRLSLGDHVSSRESAVRLMTLHAAKGLESAVVFMPGLEEGLLPYRRSLDVESAIEEERRLCYVGITRARELLYLSYAHGRMLGGQAALGQPSRFIAEIGRVNLTLKISGSSRRRPRPHSVRVGERVTHARWSEGTVVAMEGEGRETMVTIQFDRFGRQRLQLCHAPLTRIEKGDVDVLAG